MRFAVHGVSQNKNGYIMFLFGFENIVGKWPVLNILKIESGFFQYFSSGTSLNRFAKLKMTTRRRPSARTVCPLSFSEKYAAVLNNQNTDPNLW